MIIYHNQINEKPLPFSINLWSLILLHFIHENFKRGEI